MASTAALRAATAALAFSCALLSLPQGASAGALIPEAAGSTVHDGAAAPAYILGETQDSYLTGDHAGAWDAYYTNEEFDGSSQGTHSGSRGGRAASSSTAAAQQTVSPAALLVVPASALAPAVCWCSRLSQGLPFSPCVSLLPIPSFRQ